MSTETTLDFGVAEILPVVNQMLDIWKKYKGQDKYPEYYGEMSEGLYHIINSLPEESKPDDLPLFFH